MTREVLTVLTALVAANLRNGEEAFQDELSSLLNMSEEDEWNEGDVLSEFAHDLLHVGYDLSQVDTERLYQELNADYHQRRSVQAVAGPSAPIDELQPLVQIIVDVLQRPLVRNRFSPSYIELLRRVLLTPSEMALVRAQEHLVCAECGVTLTNGEAMTLGIGGSGPGLFCYTCVEPMSRACGIRGCAERVNLESGRSYCPTHFAARQGLTQPDVWGTAPSAGSWTVAAPNVSDPSTLDSLSEAINRLNLEIQR